MHSDLEEGEILDDKIDEIEPEISPCVEWNPPYLNSKSSNNILTGSFGTIPRLREHWDNAAKHSVSYPQNCYSSPSDESSSMYLGHVRCNPRSGRHDKTKHYGQMSKSPHSGRRKKRTKGSSSTALSHPSCQAPMHSAIRAKTDWRVKENKRPNNIRTNKGKFSRSARRKKGKSKGPYLNEHQKAYFDSFEKSVTDTNCTKIFPKSEGSNISKLKVDVGSIKPGSIGEMLMKRKANNPPIEIMLSDTEDSSSQKIENPTLSDDEYLLMLRRKALDSCNKTVTNSNESKEHVNAAENSNKITSDSATEEVHHEPVDMEISISDDESGPKEKKEFPIEWAYMMPPPSDKEDSSIHTLNRWCYDQNMYVQAMESTTKEATSCDAVDGRNTISRSHCSLNPPQFASDDCRSVTKAGAKISPHNNFSDSNLTGGYAKQYKAFMEKIFQQQHTSGEVDSSEQCTEPVSSIIKPLEQSNLIQIPLQPYVVTKENLNPTAAPEKQVDEEYDEDLLLATLLIDQEKRAQKRQEKTNLKKNSDLKQLTPKKRTKRQTGFKKKLKPHPKLIGGHGGVTRNSSIVGIDSSSSANSYIEYGKHKFPKIKPVIISLQSDSDNESDHVTTETPASIDTFIRSIRNSKQNSSSSSQNVQKSQLAITSQSVCYRSNTQEDVKLLELRLETAQSNIDRQKILLQKSNKTSALHKTSPKKKLTKFNFAMGNPPLPVKNNTKKANSNLNTRSEEKSPLVQTTSCQEASSNAVSFVESDEPSSCAHADGISTNICNDQNESPLISDSTLLISNEDDEDALRKFLLQSLKPKPIKGSDICSGGKASSNKSEVKVELSFTRPDDKPEDSSSGCPTNSICSDSKDGAINGNVSNFENGTKEPGTFMSISHDTCNTESTDQREVVEKDIHKTAPECQFIKVDKFCTNKSNVELAVEATITEVVINPDSKVSDVPKRGIVLEQQSPDSPTSCTSLPSEASLASRSDHESQTRSEPVLHPSSPHKAKKEDNSRLLKIIEQDVVKERNKVFSLRQKLTEDIRQSERYFTESGAISSLICSLRAQLIQAEHKFRSKATDAKAKIETLLDKKTRLRKHINRSKELQELGEKIGKQVIGHTYTFPSPPTNYEKQYQSIELDLWQLKKRVHQSGTPGMTAKITGTTIVPARTTSAPLMFKNRTPKKSMAVGKQIFKIDKRSAPLVKRPLKKVLSPTRRYLNLENFSSEDFQCPHDLLGRCNDDFCSFVHLPTAAEKASATKPLKQSFSNSPAKVAPKVTTGGPINNNAANRLPSVPAAITSSQRFNVKHNERTNSTSSHIKLNTAVVCLNRLTNSQIDSFTSKNIACNTIRSRLRKRKTT